MKHLTSLRLHFWFLMLASLLTQCKSESPQLSIQKSHYGTLSSGEEVLLFILKNQNGMEVGILNYGGIITSIRVPDKNNHSKDVVLGFESLSDYEKKSPYFGALVGRYANRIAGGSFTLDGQEYSLVKNNGSNHLHGGTIGFDKVIWKAKEMENEEAAALELSYTSRDMEEGYPGNLNCKVTYTLNDKNELSVVYEASTDKKTVVNMTQHSYFNLSGDFSEPVLNHEVLIDAEAFIPVDSELIPTGEIKKVNGTPFDFRKATKIGAHIDDANEQLERGNGFDHCWVLNGQNSGLRVAATAFHPETGRFLEVLTTEPGIQLYTGNFLDGSLPAKGGGTYSQRSGFCMETQHYPDSPNQKAFPSVVLEPGEKYQSQTIFRFSSKDQ